MGDSNLSAKDYNGPSSTTPENILQNKRKKRQSFLNASQAWRDESSEISKKLDLTAVNSNTSLLLNQNFESSSEDEDFHQNSNSSQNTLSSDSEVGSCEVDERNSYSKKISNAPEKLRNVIQDDEKDVDLNSDDESISFTNEFYEIFSAAPNLHEYNNHFNSLNNLISPEINNLIEEKVNKVNLFERTIKKYEPGLKEIKKDYLCIKKEDDIIKKKIKAENEKMDLLKQKLFFISNQLSVTFSEIHDLEVNSKKFNKEEGDLQRKNVNCRDGEALVKNEEFISSKTKRKSESEELIRSSSYSQATSDNVDSVAIESSKRRRSYRLLSCRPATNNDPVENSVENQSLGINHRLSFDRVSSFLKDIVKNL
ncbi:hypothetical protein HK099_000072 [Clydaea vesicula]|uniref:Uncharacterized protein n=1 Tax=Clydaea vesicula TaxID=447962 RepID=A0AAD5UBS4_9FUNG|nr:hypothetical protein HK099_000072 [Clydaea vesicula]KAJ3389711.1 hypothetical protein HDU92_000909 [Lobulomyces angularis]